MGRDTAPPTRRQAIVGLSAGAAGAWIAPQIISAPAASAATVTPVTPPDFIAVGFDGALARGIDDGATWETSPIVTPPGTPVLASVVRAGSSAWVVAVNNGPSSPEVWRTVDDGASFTLATTPPVTTEYPALAAGDGAVLLATRPGPIGRSTDQGNTWAPAAPLGVGVGVEDIAFGGGQWAAVSTSGIVYLTFDPSFAWGVPPGFVAPPNTQTLRCIGASGSTIVAAGDASAIRRSADGGATWTTPTVNGTGGTLYAITAVGTRWVAVGDAGTAFVSADDGATWAPAPGLSLGISFRGVAGITTPSDPIFVAAGVGGAQAYRSTDGGVSWGPIPPVLGNLTDVAS